MPPKSWRIATGRPCFLEIRRMLAITSACSSNVPWEKFSRAQSRPRPMSCSNMSGSLEAGPMVTMIFVLRMVTALSRLGGKLGPGACSGTSAKAQTSFAGMNLFP